MIEIGQQVKYFLRNGMVLEGFVEKDTASECILKSLDGKSLIIIHSPATDILITKIILEEKTTEMEISSENKGVEKNEPSEHQLHIRSKMHEVLQPSGDPKLDQLNIKQLRDLVVQQDRKMIEQKTKQHFGNPGNAKVAVKYTNSFLFKK
jgi:hypothetical protein